MTTIVIISNSNEIRHTILNSLDSLNCCLLPLNSLAELPAVLHEIPINGIIIDIITATRATASEKQDTFHILQLFPHIKVKLHQNEIRAVGATTLEQFMLEACKDFESRIIRKSPRLVRHVGVEIRRPAATGESERSFTYNFSLGGCFVCSTGNWLVGEQVQLSFVGFGEVVAGRVCWWEPWGARKVPGVGIKFDPLPDDILRAFNDFWL